MKFNNRININPEYASLLEFRSESEEIRHEASMIMFRFLSEIEKLNDRTLQKKDIAKAIDTSPSYVTQLFNGDKLVNLLTLAKLQKAFDITFEITAVPTKKEQVASTNVFAYIPYDNEQPDFKL
ncbi:MAG: helix-turn-helix transcriptional regulator [Chitinophagaceae bacterium]